jgi:hypothetical protein
MRNLDRSLAYSPEHERCPQWQPGAAVSVPGTIRGFGDESAGDIDESKLAGTTHSVRLLLIGNPT